MDENCDNDASSKAINDSTTNFASAKFDFDSDDDDRVCNHFMYDDYFRNDSIESFHIYDLLSKLQYSVKRDRKSSRFEKFKNYWENYSFYAIWRRKFIEDHSCDENDIWREFFIAAIPHLIINIVLILYVLFGAIIFQFIDPGIQKEEFRNVVQFTFTTIATVGYGNIVPTTEFSKIYCMLYTLIGIPLMFLSLTNIGQFLAEGYWIFLASLYRQEKYASAHDERRLPITVVVILLLTHSVIGGFLFHFWIDQMPVVPAIYFSFVSITTIGYGDITPTPNGAFQTFIIICYLSIGIVIMSTFVAALYNYLHRLHYLGRNFSGAANVEVWFGGTRMSIAELLQIIAEQFNVSPKTLCNVLRDLDDLISASMDPRTKTDIEARRNCSSNAVSAIGGKHQSITFELENSTKSREAHVLLRPGNEMNIAKLAENERESVMQALGMLHHITKTKSNARRNSSASHKLLNCTNDSNILAGL